MMIFGGSFLTSTPFCATSSASSSVSRRSNEMVFVAPGNFFSSNAVSSASLSGTEGNFTLVTFA